MLQNERLVRELEGDPEMHQFCKCKPVEPRLRAEGFADGMKVHGSVDREKDLLHTG
ncbi:hypothetical protein KBY57_04225 [Cyanobium sp. Aljojuca 7D2]|uniref:hypothetical protein n=1 Tax=Cyanobium sp. Aljojuca 7D2 TaxID=2823698 RepID=UPI0020CD3A23|nr:hypothetical protein [Cyanobium sp. Aljojuca 7D2]MCP9890270.1 hypothetical protein [Cyanobium sp. Aljojuca 7D2]